MKEYRNQRALRMNILIIIAGEHIKKLEDVWEISQVEEKKKYYILPSKGKENLNCWSRLSEEK